MMFEKEAEEIANKRCHEIMCFGHCSFSSPKHHRCGEWHREYNCAKEGIEYGYNKANEWHYVKDGDLPKDGVQVLSEKGHLVIYKGDCFCWFEYSPNADNIKLRKWEEPYAWKEIVLPELQKEMTHDQD